MSPSLPHISGAEAIRALEKLGFVGTLSGVLKQAGVSAEDFLAALKS